VNLDPLVDSFVAELNSMKQSKAGAGLKAMLPRVTGPTELMKRIEEAMDITASGGYGSSDCGGLAFCLEEPLPADIRIERHERLPLSLARKSECSCGSR